MSDKMDRLKLERPLSSNKKTKTTEDGRTLLDPSPALPPIENTDRSSKIRLESPTQIDYKAQVSLEAMKKVDEIIEISKKVQNATSPDNFNSVFLAAVKVYTMVHFKNYPSMNIKVDV